MPDGRTMAFFARLKIEKRLIEGGLETSLIARRAIS